MTTAAAAEEKVPFFLRGNYAPVAEERTELDLKVEGAIPPVLRGRYVRNGPNPRDVQPPHWFFGDGMLHGVELGDGRALWYRNRWLQTRQLTEGARVVSPDGVRDLSAGPSNTNIVRHAGRMLALAETTLPFEVTRELESKGVFDFGGRLKTGMTAHPKICPVTGELHFFDYGFFPPYLTYHRADAAGNLVQSEDIDVPGPTMMHDFAITARHVIFMDLPIVFDLMRAMQGTMPYTWSDDYGARVGVMPRGGNASQVRWFEVDPCYVFHPMNAFEEGDRVVVDVARYPELWRADSGRFDTASLHRWELDLATGHSRESALDDRAIEFPRVDDRRTGIASRYGYAVHNVSSVESSANALLKYDLVTGSSVQHDFGPGCYPSEGVFAPDPSCKGDDEGWILTFVYDEGRNGSDLVILDARDFARRPVARIALPQRVPFGFHGNWMPE
ncbi:MAG TPA: carotenoid oxygenase family protein [Candidatus Limnocylindrales bacterium]|nr:carotenoid oxygenase family protein [Candidatus Limnocylindrales bacterium]